jgi:hypothetical protein
MAFIRLFHPHVLNNKSITFNLSFIGNEASISDIHSPTIPILKAISLKLNFKQTFISCVVNIINFSGSIIILLTNSSLKRNHFKFPLICCVNVSQMLHMTDETRVYLGKQLDLAALTSVNQPTIEPHHSHRSASVALGHSTVQILFVVCPHYLGINIPIRLHRVVTMFRKLASSRQRNTSSDGWEATGSNYV